MQKGIDGTAITLLYVHPTKLHCTINERNNTESKDFIAFHASMQ